MRQVTCLGYYGKHNTGDECYKIVFPRLFPGYEFSFTDILNPKEEYRSVVLGGGNVAGKEYIDQLKKLPSNIPCHVLSIGVTPDDPVDYLDKRCDYVVVRDYRSLEILQNKNVHCGYLPDFSWTLVPNKENGRKKLVEFFAEDKSELYEKVVAVCVNANLLPGDSTSHYNGLTWEKFVADLAKLMDTAKASFLMIPFGCARPDDRVANGLVYHRCKWYKKMVSVTSELTPQDKLDLLAACDAAISSRYHASVFCAIAGRPFIDVTHHDKNLYFTKNIGKEHWSTPYYSWSWCNALKLLEQHLAVEPDVKYLALAEQHRKLLAEACRHFFI